jgi:hypothetical protein
MSQASNSSQGFWRHSQVEKARYRQKNLDYGSNYKQRREQLNRDRDMKWNGPHDEEFFRCFEQHLADAIRKFKTGSGSQKGCCTPYKLSEEAIEPRCEQREGAHSGSKLDLNNSRCTRSSS